jgi:polysaccharide export outer membrane protein
LLLGGCSSKEEYILFYNDTVHQNGVDKDKTVNVLPKKSVNFEYKIQPHDRISLIIYKHPEFSTTTIGAPAEDKGALVDSNGYVSLPLIDEIHIAGLTQKEARKKIEAAFSNYLKYSKVKLEVLNKRAYIVGEVKQAGEIELFNEKTSLLKIIAKAGDLTDSANRQNILILREDGNTTQVHRINLVDLNSIAMANTMVYPNDIVYVPPVGMKSFNVKVNEYDAVFRLAGHVLSPFVNIKYLSD